MKVQVLQENLNKGLSFSTRFVNAHASLPILGNILFSAHKNQLTLMSTNLEMSLSYTIGAKVEEEGKIGIPSKMIHEIVAHLPKGQVDINEEKEQIKITGEGFSGNVAGVNAGDFPSIPVNFDEVTPKSPVFTLKCEDFLSALSKVLFAVSTDETRPILTGVLFIFTENNLTLVASDGFRLSQKKIMGKFSGSRKVVLPKSAIAELAKIADGVEEIQMQIRESANQVLFAIGDECFLTTRIIEGEFPNFERIIPTKTNTAVSVDKADFGRSLKLASVFARDAANIVKLKVNKDSIEIYAESTQLGSQKAKLDAKVDGGELEISYNYRFIEEFLNTVKGEEVVLALVDSNSPGIFKDPKDPEFLHLIMPVKVQS